MYYEVKITNNKGVHLKTEQVSTMQNAEMIKERLEAKGLLVEIKEVVTSPPSSSLYPTAMYSGDPGVRSSIRDEGLPERTWKLSEEERFDIAEDG